MSCATWDGAVWEPFGDVKRQVGERLDVLVDQISAHSNPQPDALLTVSATDIEFRGTVRAARVVNRIMLDLTQSERSATVPGQEGLMAYDVQNLARDMMVAWLSSSQGPQPQNCEWNGTKEI